MEILVYSKAVCPYCDRAKALLKKKGLEFKELRVDQDPALLEEMLTRSQRRTVPQIFIDGQHIGGFDDLYAFDQSGDLDKLLGKS